MDTGYLFIFVRAAFVLVVFALGSAIVPLDRSAAQNIAADSPIPSLAKDEDILAIRFGSQPDGSFRVVFDMTGPVALSRICP